MILIQILAFVGTLALLGCQGSHPSKSAVPEAASAPAPALQGSMLSFKDSLSQILPLVIDSTQFNAPENRERIDKDVADLLKISKQVVHSPQVKNTDPSLRFISTAFADDLKKAKESLDADKREFARYTLLNVTAYCIECHTRTAAGPSFSTPQLEKTLQNLKPMEKGDYLLATRQYDQAYSEFEQAIKNSLGRNGNLFDLDRAVRYGLSIAIKFQNNPKKALEIAKLVEKSDRSPLYLRQSAKSWEQSIQLWMKEKPRKSDKVEDVLKHGEHLVTEGQKFQTGLGERGGDIYFLRALAEFQPLLSKNLVKNQLGETLYMTGESYEAERDLSIWSLHENYYEACIREVPHSDWAEKCYGKLESSTYFGYTGSSGLRVPGDVQAKLDGLKVLAFPETAVAPDSKPDPSKQ